MADDSLYKTQLLQHYRHPHNRGGLEEASHKQRGSNPRCGDELEVGLFTAGPVISQVRFIGRGCSVCIASASMMTEAVAGLDHGQMQQLYETVRDWLGDDSTDPIAIPEVMRPLSAVRAHPARRKCALLCWEALRGALDRYQGLAPV